MGEIKIESADEYDSGTRLLRATIEGPSGTELASAASKLEAVAVVTALKLRDGGLRLVEELTAKLKDELTTKMDAVIYTTMIRHILKIGTIPKPTGTPLGVSYDAMADVLTVNSYKFSGAMFRNLTEVFPLGSWFQIQQRDDGVLTTYSHGAGRAKTDFGTIEDGLDGKLEGE